MKCFDRPILFALAVAMASVVGTVDAQPSRAPLADCHAIQGDQERLACYDRLSGRGDASGRVGSPAAPAPTDIATPVAPAPVDATSAATADPSRPSLLEKSWGLEPDSSRYAISLYRPNYLLPVRYSSHVNNAPSSPVLGATVLSNEGLEATEAKFQISGKVRLWSSNDRRWGFYGAYTQQNQWQLYNNDLSRPFRETNYMPEAFVTYAPGWSLAGVNLRLINFGYTHQSNGRSDPLSRSWERLFVEAGMERGNLVMFARAWHRIPEGSRKDDNPDITDFLGHGEINAIYHWGGNSFTGALRGNVRNAKGAVQLGWYSAPLLGPLRAYVQFFSGYGESLIDYNWNQRTIGAGIALNDGL